MLLMIDIQQVVYRHVYGTPQIPSPFSPPPNIEYQTWYSKN